MSVILKGCTFEHTKLLIHFKSFNDECAMRSLIRAFVIRLFEKYHV